MSSEDPIDDLRAAWGQLDSPNPTPDENDETTQAVVDALRTAWLSIEVPEVDVPFQLHRRRASRMVTSFARIAAGLLVLAGGAALLRQLPPGRDSLNPAPSETTDIAQATAQIAPELLILALEPNPIENGIVVTHGKVRLVMLEPTLPFEPMTLDAEPENSK
ncbi:MAG: hypothetical protein ACI9F9_001841 [Candidatus Paceibacteria bacterium]|jgi:hypothetical protein